MIDIKLIKLPSKFTKKTFVPYANKINLAYRLGAISREQLGLLHYLRDARNEFAHKIVSSLDDEEISKGIEKIFSALPDDYQKFIEEWTNNIHRTLKEHGVEIGYTAENIRPRIRFNNFISQVISDLYADLIRLQEK